MESLPLHPLFFSAEAVSIIFRGKENRQRSVSWLIRYGWVDPSAFTIVRTPAVSIRRDYSGMTNYKSAAPDGLF